MVLVRPDARVPADGTIVDGQTEVDDSMITGEPKAVAFARSGWLTILWVRRLTVSVLAEIIK